MLALVLSLGLHWTLLQSAAWVGMVVNYSRDASLGEALEKTFDGEHPCALCKMVEAGSSQEDQDQSKPSSSGLKKIDLALVLVEPLITPPPFVPEFPALTLRPDKMSAMPSVPPPRAV